MEWHSKIVLMEIEAYLERIGIDEMPSATLESLSRLQESHMLHVPFENLNIHWGIPIELNVKKLYQKIVGNNRGGFCYEQNGLFHWLLTELGFRVNMLSARVFSSQTEEWGPEFDHMALLVHLDSDYLVDVGFGDSFRIPMKIPNGTVEDVSGTYRIAQSEDELLVERQNKDAWEPQYRFALTSHPLSAFEAMCRYHQTSPDSHFTQQKICSQAEPWGRISLSEGTLITTKNKTRIEEKLHSPQEWDLKLSQYFGIEALRS